MNLLDRQAKLRHKRLMTLLRTLLRYRLAL